MNEVPEPWGAQMTHSEKTTLIKEFKHHVNCISDISDTLGFGDPFSYNRMREILMAIELGHDVSTVYAGGDAVDENGEEVEYKSTIQKKLTAQYTGVSVYDDWYEQLSYLKNEKIGGYKYHYIALFVGHNKIKAIYRLTGEQVINFTEEAFKESWENRHRRKDPRLSATLSEDQILTGKKII